MKQGAEWFLSLFGALKGTEAALAYRRVFSSRDGVAVLKSLFQYCNCSSSSFVPGDPYQTAFNEGQRDVFNHIMSASSLDPSDFVLKHKESNSE